MTASTDVDVVVVGAGLAGLRCAGDLAAAGLDVVVLERDDVVGGRVRTDVVDGFLVDRGFQLLNPAYPALADLDIASLGLQGFGAGVAALDEDGLQRLGHPAAARLLPSTAAFVARHPRQAVALARWARPLLHRPGVPLARHLHDQVGTGRLAATLAESWDDAGLDGTLRRVLDRFLAGVLLDEQGRTASDLALLLVAAFLRGTPGLPRDGMRAFAALLAEASPQVRLATPVAQVQRDGSGRVVRTDAGDWRARAVVVATGAQDAATLLHTTTPPTRGVVTAWFSVGPDAPRTDLLHVDARPRPTGPLANTAVVTEAAPSYGGPGRGDGRRRLVQASAVLAPGAPAPSVAAMRQHAGELLGCVTTRWEEVAVHEVRHALPDVGVPLVVRQPVRLEDGLYVCGDHRDTPSIQGALVSGRRTARQVRADLAGLSASSAARPPA